ncbi:hypothetical protein [Sorangium sp. So ce341]|uniref:hypothetical protein n=1 Tax=Sorangium sp. So ce341 TaxID=3133302 RepID=UPI003F6125EE
MDIQLFLARTDDHEPVLAGGLPRRSAYAAPKPRTGPAAPSELEDRSGPLDSLAEQRWAIVAPKGAVGDRLLRLIEPLQRQREEEQGSPAIVYRVDPEMRPSATHAWLQRDYWDAVGRRARDLPRYLLLLGDPSLVS